MLALGYDLAEDVVDAADLGVPQHRRRLFLTARRKRPPRHLRLPTRPHVNARDVIDWSDGAEWSPMDDAGRRARGLRPLQPTTRTRIAAGRRDFGARFVVAYYGEGGARSVDRPLGTLTTRDRYGVVKGNAYRMLSVEEQRVVMSFPEGYVMPPQRKLATHLYGNAVCPAVMEAIVRDVGAWL